MSGRRVVIIGSGLAGYGVARELRKLSDAPLTLITADDGRYYSKPMLSNAFTSNKTAAAIAISSASKMAEDLRADIRINTEVQSIDLERRCIASTDTELEYDRLVLALGADQITAPVQGSGAGKVLTVNDLRDYERLRSAIEGARHMVIIGAGLIGCEFADDVRRAGIDVEVVDPAPFPLSRFLPAEAGLALQEALTGAAGIRWKLGTTVKTVTDAGTHLTVEYADGTYRDTSVVLSAIGLRPRLRLAQACGLKTGSGIQVDRQLETSDPNVYALGDCAEIDGLVLPFVMPIMHAARALARTLTGELTPVVFPAMPVVVKTTSCPAVVAPPPPNAEGHWLTERVDGGTGLRATFRSPAGALLGFALTGTAVKDKNTLTKELPPLRAA